MKILTLHLKARWWHQIASGQKTVELRLQNDYWRKRLVGRQYDEIHLWQGYPPKTQTDKLLRRQWQLVAVETLQHEEFGPHPVNVFVIDVSQPLS